MNANTALKSLAAVALLSVSLLTQASAQRPPIGPRPPVVAPGAPAAVRVTSVSLNMRTGPGTHFPVAGAVPRGAILTVRSARGTWLEVIDPRGRRGWVSSAHTVRVR